MAKPIFGKQDNRQRQRESSWDFNVARSDGFLSALGPQSTSFGKVTIPSYDNASQDLAEAFAIGYQSGLDLLSRRERESEASAPQAFLMPWE